MINLKIGNKRLERLAKYIPDGACVLDVGCDHAFLDIYLTLENRGIVAIASDIHEGPIEKAKENIRKYHLEDKIETRVGPGIETIDERVDTVVISGMGGRTIVGILKYQRSLLKRVERLILSPNNYTEEVRKEVWKLGYFLEQEELIEDRHFIYPILVFRKGKKHYTKKELYYGPILLRKRPVLFSKYLQKELEQKQQLLQVLPKKYWERRFQLRREVKSLQKILLSFDEK